MALMSPFPINAARLGDESAINAWKATNGKINSTLEYETWTPLHLMAAEGNLQGVCCLLKCGARTDELPPSVLSSTPSHTALHVACRYGHEEVIAHLVKSGNIDLVDNHGFTPLHFAATNGHVAAVKKLIDLGANVRVKVYAKSQGDVSELQGEGFTAGDMAFAAGHHTIAKLLKGLASSSSVDEQEKLKGWLEELGCVAYYSKFVDNGYDFGFIEAHGLDTDDVNSLGIPNEKLGLRKKLLAMYKFPYSSKSESKEDIEEASDASESEAEVDGEGSDGEGSDSEGSDSEGSDSEASGSGGEEEFETGSEQGGSDSDE